VQKLPATEACRRLASVLLKEETEIASTESRGTSEGAYLGLMRMTAQIAVVAGAVASAGLLLQASSRAPRLLLVLFELWVVSPFLALAWTNMVSKNWTVLTRATLYCMTLVLALGSLAIYGQLISPPANRPHAFVYIVVPPASWLILAITVPLAALISRRLSQGGARA
jgi:hypothetical protein